MIPAVSVVENCYVFKSRLQEYAQKAGLPTPEYQTLKEGPSHEPVFKSTVLVNGVSYDSLPGFFSRKAAEQSAAEVALMEIAKSLALPATATIPAVQETGLCKNLLQEYAQKMNYPIPSYISHRQASGVAPFISTVEIGGIQYIGAAARTKKEAEIKAARTALLAIQGQSDGSANGGSKYIVVPGMFVQAGNMWHQMALISEYVAGFKLRRTAFDIWMEFAAKVVGVYVQRFSPIINKNIPSVTISPVHCKMLDRNADADDTCAFDSQEHDIYRSGEIFHQIMDYWAAKGNLLSNYPTWTEYSASAV